MTSYIGYIKLFDYNFTWNCLEFSCKINLTTEMIIFNNAKHRHEICWQTFYFYNHVRIWSKGQHLLYNQTKSNFILSYVLGICCRCRKLTYFNLLLKEMRLVKGIVKFAVESLVFRNRLVNGTHSILNIKLPWVYKSFFGGALKKLSLLG